MKNLAMIASVSQDRGLGHAGELLWHIPRDMNFFRETTTGHTVVMGSKTYASIGRPLPNRRNIILTSRDLPNLPPSVEVCHSQAELDQLLAKIDGPKFIIGGTSLYTLYLDQADTHYLTEVAATRPADVYFPDFDHHQYRRTVLETGCADGIEFTIVKYERC